MISQMLEWFAVYLISLAVYLIILAVEKWQVFRSDPYLLLQFNKL